MERKTAPWTRILIMLLATVALAWISHRHTGSYLPVAPNEALVFQNALLLIVLGSALLEHHYTRPADSLVNSLMGMITLLGVYSTAPTLAWSVIMGYCGAVFVLSTLCVAVSSGPKSEGWQRNIADFTYRPATVLGSARLLFSLVFLAGLWFFYSIQNPLTVELVLFWGIFIVLWPLGIPSFLTSVFTISRSAKESLGEITRIDNPNIVRLRLATDVDWNPEMPRVVSSPSGEVRWIQPLYSGFQEGALLATGLLTGLKVGFSTNRRSCLLDTPASITPPTKAEICLSLGAGQQGELIGFVVERSSIGTIKFETINPDAAYDGMLVWCPIGDELIYYQVVEGETTEESFAADKYGFQIATASQLGRLRDEEGFEKFDWLPWMNVPIFGLPRGQTLEAKAVSDDDFLLGNIPNSSITVGGDFKEHFNQHTAILGVTGSGKTELAFEIIRHSVENGIKVICIDLTAQYQGRLNDLNPTDLSIETGLAQELGEKLFDVETGQYGAGNEKKALSQFATALRDNITDSVSAFLGDQTTRVGLIRLEEISNTKATLWITELFMTCLLKFARENEDSPDLLIVVEEAHTVMPEATTMGLGDFDSRGLVGKIGQIALQGRKYGVGLLVLAQRTATVSKTILTQCNTIISFSCYDDTSLAFLKNIYGEEHISMISNLPRLQAIAHGPWIRSENPVVFQIPFDEDKAANV